MCLARAATAACDPAAPEVPPGQARTRRESNAQARLWHAVGLPRSCVSTPRGSAIQHLDDKASSRPLTKGGHVNGSWGRVNGRCGRVHGRWGRVHGRWGRVNGSWGRAGGGGSAGSRITCGGGDSVSQERPPPSCAAPHLAAPPSAAGSCPRRTKLTELQKRWSPRGRYPKPCH